MMHGEHCSVDKLGKLLETGDSTSVLILDCRAPNDYNACHINGAIHVVIPTLMLRRLKKGNLSVASVINCAEGKERFQSKCKKDLIVLYDDTTNKDVNNPSSVVSQLLKKLREDGCMAYILAGGFQGFQDEYPQLCAGIKGSEDAAILGLSNLNILETEHENEKEDCPTPSNANVFPVEVVPYLFLGNAKNSGDIECLNKHGIKYIINVTPNVENQFGGTGTVKYLQIPINDHWSQNIAQYFPKAISFIDEARQNKCGVLVHCLAGISRSVTVTVAYLMHSMHLSLNEAYDYVKTKKQNISPNFNFMGQLLDFEKSLKIRDCQCLCPKENTFTSPMAMSSSSSSSPASSGESHQSPAQRTTMGGPPTCTCSCHNLKSFFSTPSSTSSSCSSSSGPEFSYNNLLSHTPS